MSDFKMAIDAIEHGLLPFARPGEPPPEKKELSKRMANYKVPGFSIAFVDGEELAWARGFGLLEAGKEGPVTPETIFQAASISKLFTAMIALRLVDAGLLELDADVQEFLRSWKIPESKYTRARPDGTQPRVTLCRLLAHSAGMGIHGYRGYPPGSELPTLLQVLNGQPPANSKPVRLVQAPGKAYKYSGGGYLVVQQMIEEVSGRPLAALAKEFIFDKLGMTSSTFDIQPSQATLSRAATAHNRSGKAVPGKWHLYPEQAAASLWTTPSDLARLIVYVLKSYRNGSNDLLSAESTRQMLSPQSHIGVDWDCGLAFNIVVKGGMTRFGHPGWNEGFHSLMLCCPEAGQGVVWMANGEGGRRIGLEMTHGLAEVVQWSWW